jgi:hypothetical protein
LTAWLDIRTNRVIDLSWSQRVTVSVRGPSGTVFSLDRPVAAARTGFPAPAVDAAVAAARDDHHAVDQRALLHTLAWWCVALALLALAFAIAFALIVRRRRAETPVAEPVPTLVRG